MTDTVKLHDFRSICPKCLHPMRLAVWCRGCDDVLDRDHLHAQCIACGFPRYLRCADDVDPSAGPPPETAPLPPPAPTSTTDGAKTPTNHEHSTTGGA